MNLVAGRGHACAFKVAGRGRASALINAGVCSTALFLAGEEGVFVISKLLVEGVLVLS